MTEDEHDEMLARIKANLDEWIAANAGHRRAGRTEAPTPWQPRSLTLDIFGTTEERIAAFKAQFANQPLTITERDNPNEEQAMNPEPTVGVKWRTAHDTRTFRIVGIVDGLVVSRHVLNNDLDNHPAVPVDLEWWRRHAIIIPDPPQITAGFYVVWEDGTTSARHTLSVAWRDVDRHTGAVGVVEVIPDSHGGARLVPVDRDGNWIGGAS